MFCRDTYGPPYKTDTIVKSNEYSLFCRLQSTNMEAIFSIIFHFFVAAVDIYSLVWLRMVGGFKWTSVFYFTIWSLMLQIMTAIVFSLRYAPFPSFWLMGSINGSRNWFIVIKINCYISRVNGLQVM